MISDITLGQYFPGTSPIHKLDPRTKIILTTLFIVLVFVANNPLGFLLVAAITVTLVGMSQIPPSVVIKAVKPIVVIVIVTALLNLFMTVGSGEPLFELWFIKIYNEGIIKSVFMSLRVLFLIIGTSVVLTYTTSPIALTDGLESLLSPLKKLKVPVHVFAMMMSIALRFIPTLIEETEKIINAQKSRGADFESGNIIRRAKALVPILIPLFVSAFKRAEELATAMECRCYRGDHNRTKLNKLEYKARDFYAMGVFVILLTGMILLAILPYNTHYSGVIFDVLFHKI